MSMFRNLLLCKNEPSELFLIKNGVFVSDYEWRFNGGDSGKGSCVQMIDRVEICTREWSDYQLSYPTSLQLSNYKYINIDIESSYTLRNYAKVGPVVNHNQWDDTDFLIGYKSKKLPRQIFKKELPTNYPTGQIGFSFQNLYTTISSKLFVYNIWLSKE